MNQAHFLTPLKQGLQWAGKNLSDAAFKTFLMEFSHVDAYGFCWAGFRLLGELGSHDLTCIHYEMQEIMAHDLVRLVEEPKRDGYGRWTAAVYQVNPYFFHMRPDCFEEALSRWNAIEQTIEQKVPVFGLSSIVSIEAESESESISRVNKQNQEEESKSSSSSRTSPESEMPNAGEIAAWQQRAHCPSLDCG